MFYMEDFCCTHSREYIITGKNPVINQEIRTCDEDQQNLTFGPWYWHWPIFCTHVSVGQWVAVLHREYCKLGQYGTAVAYNQCSLASKRLP